MTARETVKQEAIAYLSSLPIPTLRIVGRKYGVERASSCHKEELIASIASLLAGTAEPVTKSKRGAPAKYNYLSPEIEAELENFKKKFEAAEREQGILVVASPDAAPEMESDYRRDTLTGILEISPSGYGFLRAKNCQPSANGDVYLSSQAIHALRLRAGDLVVCTAKPRVKNDSPALDEVLSVNGLPVGSYERRPFFDSLTAQYASEKIELSERSDDMSLRVLDLFTPIGKGQRALIIAPPKAGKTTLLKSIARSVSNSHRGINLIVLLIDERPEEVTDIRTNVSGAEVIYSTFDEGMEHHIRAAELTIEHAKRMIEQGRDVVILLDSLTKLTRAYNNVMVSSGKTLSGGLDAGALAEPKRFFGAARNTVEAGSLTILATVLVDTGSRMDEIIYEEFKGTGNCDIFLSRELADRRIFPAIDIKRSGTRKEELLLDRDSLDAVYKMRERGLVENIPGLLDMMKRTRTNNEFVARLPEWIRIYKS